MNYAEEHICVIMCIQTMQSEFLRTDLNFIKLVLVSSNSSFLLETNYIKAISKNYLLLCYMTNLLKLKSIH